MDSLLVITEQEKAIQFYRDSIDTITTQTFFYATALIAVVGILMPLMATYYQRMIFKKRLKKHKQAAKRLRKKTKAKMKIIEQKATQAAKLRSELVFAFTEMYRYYKSFQEEELDTNEKIEFLASAISAGNHFIKVGLILDNANIIQYSEGLIKLYDELPADFDLNKTYTHGDDFSGFMVWLRSEEAKKSQLYHEVIHYIAFLEKKLSTLN